MGSASTGRGTPPPPPAAAPAPWRPVLSERDPLEKLVDDLRSFNLEWVVPYKVALSPQVTRNPAVWVMLFFGFFPLSILTLNLVRDPGELIFALTGYYCMAWAGWFYYFVARRSADFSTGLGSMAFTAFVGVSLLITVQELPLIKGLYNLTQANDIVVATAGFVLGVGVFEEITKALPVLYLAYSARKIDKPLDGLFYGAMSGLGFAISEGALYISHQNENLGVVVQTLIRTTSLPFMHALWSSLSGYFIALSLVNRRRGNALAILGIGVPAVLHGLYDVTSTRMPIVSTVLALFLYLLFSAYIERSQQMVEELAHAERQQADALAHEQLRQQLWQQYVAQSTAPPAGSAAASPPQAPGQAPASPYAPPRSWRGPELPPTP